MKKIYVKRVELLILVLIIGATLLRLMLIAQNWPVTNSDEGNMALLARHVAYNGEWPIFFYGLPYMGPVEGYVAAPLFHLFGSSTFTLRLGLLPFFTLFALCMFYLTRRLYTQGLAIFTVVLLCLGSPEVIGREVKAVGEYPETLFFVAATWLLLVWLAQTGTDGEQGERPDLKRLLIYGLLGLIVGISLWVDFLVLPFVGMGAIFLWLFCRRELRTRASLSLALGIIIGLFPLIIYNVTAPLEKNSLTVLVSIQGGGQGLNRPWLQQLVGTFFVSLPNATGLNPLCDQKVFPLLHAVGIASSRSCMLVQGSWSVGYLLLWTLAFIAAVRFVWPRRQLLLKKAWTFEERQAAIRQVGQLFLLICAAATILLYALSPAAALDPSPTARYLICLLVTLPSVLWPLWLAVTRGLEGGKWQTNGKLLLSGAVLSLLVIIFSVGTVRAFANVPDAQGYYQRQDALVQKLLSLGATRIYSEYWTCNRLTFQSDEKIICAALEPDLSPGFDRYSPYRDMVRAEPRPTYIFPSNMKQVAAFEKKMKSGELSGAYQRLTFQNYVLFVPR